MDNIKKILFESNGNIDPAVSGLADAFYAGADQYSIPLSGVDLNKKQDERRSEEELSAPEPNMEYKKKLKSMITQYKQDYIQSLRNGFHCIINELNQLTREVESGQLDPSYWVADEGEEESLKYEEGHDFDDLDEEDDFEEPYGADGDSEREEFEEDYKG